MIIATMLPLRNDEIENSSRGSIVDLPRRARARSHAMNATSASADSTKKNGVGETANGHVQEPTTIVLAGVHHPSPRPSMRP